MVAAGHELTAAAAAEILQDGGNAFDACVAGLFMTFVAEAVFASPGRRRLPHGAAGGKRQDRAVRFLRRDSTQAAPGERDRLLPDLCRFRSGQAGVPYRRGLERHARRGAWPLRHASGAVPAADEAPGRARGARGARRLSALRIPGLSPHRHRADPQGDDGRGEDFCPRRHAAQSRRDLQQPRSCRDHRMARRGRRAAVRGRRCRPGHCRAAERRRLPHPCRSCRLSRGAADAHPVAARRCGRRAQPAARGKRGADRLRPWVCSGACRCRPGARRDLR